MQVVRRIPEITFVAGSLLLLVGVPPYMAQPEAGKALADGETFAYREPRVGDRVGLELVVGWGGRALSTGAHFVVEWREADDDERQAGASFARTWRSGPARVPMGTVDVLVDRKEIVELYDGTGRRVWGEHVSLREGRDDEILREHAQGIGVGERVHDRYVHTEAPRVTYRPTEPVEPLFRIFPLRTGGPDEQADDAAIEPAMDMVFRSDAEGGQAHIAVLHRGEVLFGHDLSTHTMRSGRDTKGDGRDIRFRTGDHVGGELRDPYQVWFNEPLVAGPTEHEWYWSLPGWSEPVGYHREYRDAPGRPVMTVDLVPAWIERGEAPFPTRPSEAAIGPTDDALGGITRNDTTPLPDGWTLAGLADAAAALLHPGPLKDAVARGPVAALGWSISANGTEWLLAVLDDEDKVGVMRIAGTGQDLVSVADACPDEQDFHWAISFTVYCDRPPTPGRLIPSEIAAMRPALGATQWGWDAAWPDTAVWSAEVTRDPVLSIGGSYTPGAWFAHEEEGRRWSVEFDPRDGAKVVETTVAPAPGSDQGALMPTTAAVTTAPLGALSPTAAATAWSGLLLVVLGLLARSVLYVKSFGHLPGTVWLFSRIPRDAVLDAERRSDILAMLEAAPGSTVQSIAHSIGASRTATAYHLDVLRRHGVVSSIRTGRAHRHFPMAARRAAIRAALADEPLLAEVLTQTEDEPGLTIADLRSRTRRSKWSVSRSAARLERLGLVRKERAGRDVRLFPAGAS